MTLQIGLIGAGMMGTDHARTISGYVPDARVAKVFDFDVARANELATELNASIADSAEDLIGDEGIDAIIVASPDNTHAVLAKFAIAAGKPILCEKPLGISAAESQTVVDAEIDAGKPLVTVGFMRRFDPGYVALKRELERGALGKARLVHNVHRNQVGHPSISTKGIVINSMIHELDIVSWLVGSPLSSIRIDSPVDVGLRDPLLAILHLADGTLSTVEVFIFASYGYDVRCEIVGTTATAALNPQSTLVESRVGMSGHAIPADFRTRFRDAYRLELTAWVAGAAAGDCIGPTAWDGHLANLAAAAGIQAVITGESVPVTSPQRPEFYRSDFTERRHEGP